MRLFLLLNNLSARESTRDGCDFHFDMVARFGIWNEDHKALDSCNTFAAPAQFLDVNWYSLPSLA